MVGAPNTLYLSRNHAERHGATAFVYNGIDLAEFQFQPVKSDYDLFLGRLHGVKGHRWAIEGAKRTRRRLLVAGGWRLSSDAAGAYVGQVGGGKKADLLAGAACLWMPARWDEPFGLTLVEALASGTPVLGTGGAPSPRSSRPKSVPWATRWTSWWPGATISIESTPRVPRTGRAPLHAPRDGRGYLRMFRAFLATGVLPRRAVVDADAPTSGPGPVPLP